MELLQNFPDSGFNSDPFPTSLRTSSSFSPTDSQLEKRSYWFGDLWQIVSNNHTPGKTMVPLESSEIGNLGVVGAFLVLCATLLVLHNVKNKGSKKGCNVIANLPGPKPLPIIGNAHELWPQDERSSVLLKWCKEYRPCFAYRLGPTTMVVLNSVEYIQKLLSSSDNGHLGKDPIYEIFRPVWRDGIILSRPEKWRQRRKLCLKPFTQRALSGYMHSYNKHSEQLVNYLGEMFQRDSGDVSSEEGRPINILLWRLSFRVICETTLGVDANEISDELDVITTTLEECKILSMNRILKPWLMNKYLWYFHPDKETLRKGSEALGQFAQKVIDRHRSSSKQTQPSSDGENNLVFGMKKPFVSLVEDGIDAGLDDEGLLEETMSMITAGYESTSTTMQFLLMILATHQEDQDKCRLEVDEIFENPSLSPEGKPTLEGAGNMKYLHQCLEETLRLYPTFFFYLRKLDTGLKLDDNLELPGGTTIGIFVPGIHKNPEYFPNPDAFIPDRFSVENSKGRSPYAFLPFSMGPRNCIGFKYGMLEVKVTIAWILRHFVVTSTDRLEDVKVHLDLALTPERGYNFILKKRQH